MNLNVKVNGIVLCEHEGEIGVEIENNELLLSTETIDIKLSGDACLKVLSKLLDHAEKGSRT